MEKNKIVLIQVWMGKIPDYFWYHYETTKNLRNIDFLFFTDQNIILDSPRYKVINTNIETIESDLSKILGQQIKIKSNKKCCDLKASFGGLFYDYIRDYDFFGCYDIDTFFGDINFYIKPYLSDYDFITIGDPIYHNRLSGPFLLMKNTEEIRNLFVCEDYIRGFDSVELFGFDEFGLTDVVKDRFKVKIIDSTNVIIGGGGKISYTANWCGGKLFIEDEEKMIFHFYHKKKTKLEKIGNIVSAKYDKLLIDDFMWVVHFSENYESLLPFLINSIKKYSNRKCVFYSINYTPTFKFKLQFESDQFIFKRIDIPKGKTDEKGRDFNIMCSKPKILIDAIESFPDKKFVHIDTDIYLTTNSDNISNFFKDLENYPLINSHIHDVVYLKYILPDEEWTSPLHLLLQELNITEEPVKPRKKCNIIVFDSRSKWFFQEQMEVFNYFSDKNILGILAIYDEDVANALLTKYQFHKSLPLIDIENCYNINLEEYTNTTHSFHMTDISPFAVLPKNVNDTLFFHGFKNKHDYESIENQYGNSVLDSEELVINYSNNLLTFERNTFLGTKHMENNVDFVVSDLNGNETIRLTNQSIYNYGLFFISEFPMSKGKYRLNLYEKTSGKCLFTDYFVVN